MNKIIFLVGLITFWYPSYLYSSEDIQKEITQKTYHVRIVNPFEGKTFEQIEDLLKKRKYCKVEDRWENPQTGMYFYINKSTHNVEVFSPNGELQSIYQTK